MRVATWNVNSIKARQERLLAWLARHGPDVLCLQELKVTEDKLPLLELRAAGYHVAASCQRAYNGVAILAKQPIEEVRTGFSDGVEDAEARFIEGRIGGVIYCSAYVPNGQLVGSEAWHYKLRWLGRLREYLDRHHAPTERLALMGDFNCAPEDRDVARPDEWRHTVLAHEEVRAAVRQVVAWGLVDTFRKHTSEGGYYSWWDYRMLGFPKGNGLRLDQLYATAPLAERCTRAWIDREERKGKLPSDHAPVVAELDV